MLFALHAPGSFLGSQRPDTGHGGEVGYMHHSGPSYIWMHVSAPRSLCSYVHIHHGPHHAHFSGLVRQSVPHQHAYSHQHAYVHLHVFTPAYSLRHAYVLVHAYLHQHAYSHQHAICTSMQFAPACILASACISAPACISASACSNSLI